MKKKYLTLFCFALMMQIVSAQNTWLQKANFAGIGRMGASAFSIGTKGYFGTGGDFTSAYYSDFWEYDPATDVWTQKANYPGTARYRALGFSTATTGYIATGYTGISGTIDVYAYDPSANSWTAMANMGALQRFGAVCFTIGTKVYAGTGTTNGGYANDFWEYNTVTDVWTQQANFGGAAKIYATGFSIGDKGYLGTGAEYSNIGIGTNDFWEYDTLANSWSPKANLPGTGRSEAVGFSIGAFGYIGTGTNNWGVAALADCWRYDPSTDTWTTVAAYPGGPVEEAIGFVIECKAYLGTGFTNDNSGTLQTSFWEYTPEDSACNINNNVSNLNFAATDTTLCEKFCINFFDSSANNPTAWQWIFPGGSPATSSLQNPINICYDLPGIYDVTLITTSAAGNDTLTFSNYITVYATPPFPTITQAGYTLTSSPATAYQWQYNSVDIPGATNQSYTIPQTGYYTVLVGDSNGCVNSATVYVLISGVEEMGDANIFIYPNPASNNLMVEFLNSSLDDEVTISLVNTIGQEVSSCRQKISLPDSKKEIDLRDITSGVYFIEIKSGNEFVRKKVIVIK